MAAPVCMKQRDFIVIRLLRDARQVAYARLDDAGLSKRTGLIHNCDIRAAVLQDRRVEIAGACAEASLFDVRQIFAAAADIIKLANFGITEIAGLGDAGGAAEVRRRLNHVRHVRETGSRRTDIDKAVLRLLQHRDCVRHAVHHDADHTVCAVFGYQGIMADTDLGNVDVSIEVRQSCTGARCVADAATANGCPENGLATSVTWQSYAGNSYLLHVSAPVSGTFGLKAIYTNSATTPTSPPVRQPITTEAIVPCDTLFGVDDGVEMKQEFFFGLFCINVCVAAPLAEFVLIFPFSLLGFSYGRCV